ncbi:hypothetical protein [Devosia sp. SD17-2]|uniref:hypothetical protein n=1 Tax=Devosia sp. SD17-2 TaxID=2976459 RepID=UPI0023D8A153|nr:hypothetical protein [Devosia sp. SD17-2]WEJ33268.1 hypothetical protein NYQ88_00105 [Devosia sp. SD17-2]
MKRFASILILVLVGTLPSLAALPPHYQRQAEIEAVLEAAVEVLGISKPVDGVSLVEADRYEVRFGDCTMMVRIVDLPGKGGGMVGPRQFSAMPEAPHCPPVK